MIKKLIKIIIIFSLTLNISSANDLYTIFFDDLVSKSIDNLYNRSRLYYAADKGARGIYIGNNRIYYDNNDNKYIPNGTKKIKLYVPKAAAKVVIKLMNIPNAAGAIHFTYIDSKTSATTYLLDKTVSERTSLIVEKSGFRYFGVTTTLKLDIKNIKSFNGGYIYLDVGRDPDNKIIDGEYDSSSQRMRISYDVDYKSKDSFENWLKNEKFSIKTKMPFDSVKTIKTKDYPRVSGGSIINSEFTTDNYYTQTTDYYTYDSVKDYPDNPTFHKGKTDCEKNNYPNINDKIFNLVKKLGKKYSSNNGLKNTIRGLIKNNGTFKDELYKLFLKMSEC